MTKTQFYKILFLSCWWISSTLFIVFYESTALGFKSAIEGLPYDFSMILVFALSVSICSATAVALFEVLILTSLFRKKPFGYTLLIKTLFYLCCIVVFQSMAVLLVFSDQLGLPLFHNDAWQLYLTEHIYSGRLFMAVVYWGFSISLALFILQVSDKFGQGVLLNFLLGKYHKPKEDHRIFMFMDLKSSTTYAEKLGHIKYSQLIQDCFFDVTEIVNKNEAKIYQYVGDEVVLSWEMDKGTKDNNCINTFFEYDNLLISKSYYYKTKYGFIPEFKAGVNSGFVTVAEVGELKKELAYHGDVLNTAARIQGKCNEYNSKLLISEEIKNQLNTESNFKFDLIGNIKLKGKEQSVNIFQVIKSY
jgi:adenylate cyclase